MGSDTTPERLSSAVFEASRHLPCTSTLVVIATKPVIDRIADERAKAHLPKNIASLEFQVVSDVIEMVDNPLLAIRKKQNSSLVVGMKQLKKRALDAFVSCGNTGALIACATLFLRPIPGVSRPALLVQMPTKRGFLAVLDVGGNVLCKSEHLVKFAFLGAAYKRALAGIEVPIVGLLNIGVESKKGTAELRQTHETLQKYCNDLAANGIAPQIHFAGNVEGRDVFSGAIDVLVTDGFTGNVLLKTSEGVASFIFDSLETTISNKTPLEFLSTFEGLKKQFNYQEYPGAIVCGVDGIVIKVHGNATELALFNSILNAFHTVKGNILQKIQM